MGWLKQKRSDGISKRRIKRNGHALYIAQMGAKYKNTKPLKGFGGTKVLEIVCNSENGTFRTMYTVQFEDAVYVLHAFQKKSKSGIKTPKSEMDMVEQRLKRAQELHSQGNR